jgi:hypothetical protein
MLYNSSTCLVSHVQARQRLTSTAYLRILMTGSEQLSKKAESLPQYQFDDTLSNHTSRAISEM